MIDILTSKNEMRPVVARGAKCNYEIDWLWVFTFTFLRSGVEAQRGIEFRHIMLPELGTNKKMGYGMS